MVRMPPWKLLGINPLSRRISFMRNIYYPGRKKFCNNSLFTSEINYLSRLQKKSDDSREIVGYWLRDNRENTVFSMGSQWKWGMFGTFGLRTCKVRADSWILCIMSDMRIYESKILHWLQHGIGKTGKKLCTRESKDLHVSNSVKQLRHWETGGDFWSPRCQIAWLQKVR